ncbi:MAG: hypothetical protein H0U71_06155 [Gammaproteobacteria bacterium]|nr:hypothetical protein [Gammaproteobacteria bacterium]
MKKLTLTCLVLSLVLTLPACQQSQSELDTAKIQESIDKIKSKIQESLNSQKSDNKKDESSSDEPNSAD